MRTLRHRVELALLEQVADGCDPRIPLADHPAVAVDEVSSGERREVENAAHDVLGAGAFCLGTLQFPARRIITDAGQRDEQDDDDGNSAKTLFDGHSRRVSEPRSTRPAALGFSVANSLRFSG